MVEPFASLFANRGVEVIDRVPERHPLFVGCWEPKPAQASFSVSNEKDPFAVLRDGVIGCVHLVDIQVITGTGLAEHPGDLIKGFPVPGL